MSDSVAGFIFVLFMVFFMLCGAFINRQLDSNKSMRELRDEVMLVIEACESKLPRDQHCKYVITAEVKK